MMIGNKFRGFADDQSEIKAGSYYLAAVNSDFYDLGFNSNFAAIETVEDIYLLGTIKSADLLREPDKTASGTLQVEQTITRKLTVNGITLSNVNNAALDELESSQVDLFFIHESELQNFQMGTATDFSGLSATSVQAVIIAEYMLRQVYFKTTKKNSGNDITEVGLTIEVMHVKEVSSKLIENYVLALDESGLNSLYSWDFESSSSLDSGDETLVVATKSYVSGSGYDGTGTIRTEDSTKFDLLSSENWLVFREKITCNVTDAEIFRESDDMLNDYARMTYNYSTGILSAYSVNSGVTETFVISAAGTNLVDLLAIYDIANSRIIIKNILSGDFYTRDLVDASFDDSADTTVFAYKDSIVHKIEWIKS
jgi:hypothetical protein